jgi:hypothetical protein
LKVEIDYRPAEGHPGRRVVEPYELNPHHGSLVSGYKAAFLASIGLSVIVVLDVAIHMRTRAAPKGTA